jgi:hypothetical protein
VTEILNGAFMERHFGTAAAAVSAALVSAGQEAHTRSMDAKAGSRLRSNHAYGSTFWLALPEEVVDRLGPLLTGSIPFPPDGAQYELLVWNDIAILPVKVIDGGTRGGRMRARISHLRTRLTSVNMPGTPEPTLFDDMTGFELDEFEAEAMKVVQSARAALANMATTMLLVAYACNANSGLQTVQVGIATLDADGFINFSDSQQLSINEPTLTTNKPVPVAGDTFDSAPRPKPLLEVVSEDKTATGEHEPGTAPDGHETK